MSLQEVQERKIAREQQYTNKQPSPVNIIFPGLPSNKPTNKTPSGKLVFGVTPTHKETVETFNPSEYQKKTGSTKEAPKIEQKLTEVSTPKKQTSREINKEQYAQERYGQSQLVQRVVGERQKVIREQGFNVLTGRYLVRTAPIQYAENRGLSQKLYREAFSAQTEWHPETKITRTEQGYQAEFPYPGAEKYGSTKKYIEKLSSFDRFMLNMGVAFTPTGNFGVAQAYYAGTGQKSKALDIEIQGLHYLKTTPIEKYLIESPYVQTGVITATMVPVGAGMGAVSGRLLASGSTWGLRAFKIGSTVVGGALVAPQAIETYKNFSTGKTGEGLGNLAVMGSQFAGAGVGAKMGHPIGFKYGATRGFNKFISNQYKTGKIDANEYNAFRNAMKTGTTIGKQIDLKMQPQAGFKDVMSVKKTPRLREYFWKKTPTIKHELFGGTISGKPQGTHDIDIMLKPKGYVEFKIASKIITKEDVSSFVDIKMPVKPGNIVTELGDIKLKPDIAIVEGERFTVMKGREQFNRLFASSMRPAHTGRLKDIPESIRLAELWGKGKPEVNKFVESMRYIEKIGEKHPFISTTERAASIYNRTSLKEIWYNVRGRFWNRILSDQSIKNDISRVLSKGNIPPSPSPSIIYSPVIFPSNVSLSVKTKYSSGSIIPSDSISLYPVSPSSNIPNYNSGNIKSVPSNIPSGNSYNTVNGGYPRPVKTSKSSSKNIKSPSPYSGSYLYPPYYPYSAYYLPPIHGRGTRGYDWNMNLQKYRFRKAPFARNPFDVKIPKVSF
jgi:hypothetical protein